MALYLPGYFLAFWAMDSYGLRSGLCIAAVLQTVGAWIRYLGILGASDNHANNPQGFALCMVGQCLAALAQPMFTKSVSRHIAHAPCSALRARADRWCAFSSCLLPVHRRR
jgi:hypothetical protein